MKKLLFIITTILLVSCNQTKIAYVDFEVLMNEYEAVKVQRGQLEEKQEMYTRELDELQAQFQTKVQEYYKNSSSMTPSKRTETENSLKQEQQTIQARQQQASEELQKQNQENNDIFTFTVDSIATIYAKEEGYNLILRSLGNSDVIYGDKTVNITPNVLEILNNNPLME